MPRRRAGRSAFRIFVVTTLLELFFYAFVYQDETPRYLDLPAGYARPAAQVSERTAQAIDEAVHRVVTRAFETATRVLGANREVLTRCAKELLEKETLEEDRLKELATDLKRPEAAARKPTLAATR